MVINGDWELDKSGIWKFFGVIKNYTNEAIYDIYNDNVLDYADYADYKIINQIIKRSWLNDFSGCSKEVQDTIRVIYWIEESERFLIHNERKKLLRCLKKIRLIWAIKSVYSILCLFFARKKRYRRLMNIWKNIGYEWIDKDKKYLNTIIKQIWTPEKKSEMAYLLWKIKEKKVKKKMKKFIKKLDQFDLLLQQCKRWEIMLTNWLNLDWSSSLFKELTQAVSGSRRCHALIISDVIKDKHWMVKDLKIIQSTLNWWVHEITFRKYIKENYSKSDFLLASFPEDRRESIILNAKNHIWQKYDRISMILDIVTWWDFKYLWKDIQDINKTYCSALVFDAVWRSGYDIPKAHLTPSDILLIKDLIPEYACYCDRL